MKSKFGKLTTGVAMGALVLLLGMTSSFGAPNSVRWSGELSYDDGSLYHGNVAIFVEIYNEGEGGTATWGPIPYQYVKVTYGGFSLVLSDGDSPGLLNAITNPVGAWLQFSINGALMSPRFEVFPVPMALIANDAEKLGGVAASEYALSSGLGAVATSNDYTTLDNLPNLATVATTGAFTDLVGGPKAVPGGEDLKIKGNLAVGGDVAANAFSGDGSGLTGLNLPSGTCPDGEVVSGLAADGSLICKPMPDGTGSIPNILKLANDEGAEQYSFKKGARVHVVGAGFGKQPKLLVNRTDFGTENVHPGEITFIVGGGADGGQVPVEVINTESSRRSNQMNMKLEADLLGDGRDGSPNLSGELDEPRTRLASDAVTGDTKIQVDDTSGLNEGDKFLIISLQGETGAGVWEMGTISAVGGTQIVVSPLKNSYYTADKVMVMRMPQYSSATVSGDLTAPSWNHDAGTGGVLAFASMGSVTIDSGVRVHMDGRGYQGNDHTSGESWSGSGCSGPTACGGGVPQGCQQANNGGGGGIWSTPACPEPSTGGGGHAEKGGDGLIDSSNSCYGEGGHSYGDPDLATIFMGSGGGGLNSNAQATGGSGGGIVIIYAASIVNSGVISSNGTGGGHTHHQAAGGGAGGSILLKVPKAAVGEVQGSGIEADGGPGGIDPHECSYRPTGGDGSPGRRLVSGF